MFWVFLVLGVQSLGPKSPFTFTNFLEIRSDSFSNPRVILYKSKGKFSDIYGKSFRNPREPFRNLREPLRI